ncbi:MAG: succinate dehydrogenase / fumarate reductase, flavoprotein subunit [Thermoplasmata archaeon]|jgi:succinate dehydrogenase / fumarate reductase flavoprotein subunit|nr:succinate dehydrogenase / fumarate reductase, flavoprotein subunit [Thermoplasmata archaeon]
MAYHKFDALVVGSGGAGLMAAYELSKHKDLNVAVITKLYPVRSHTGAAQGGISAALGNVNEDHWEWHAYDTVKGSDFLGDQDAIEIMCRDAPETIIQLEHMGLPFDRLENGKISQRRFGGHTRDHGKAPVERACHSADRTGHAMLHTMYQQCLKNGVRFFNEYQVVDLVEGRDAKGRKAAAGVVAYQIETGELHTFHAKATMFASGGYGRAWKVTSNAHALTGDAIGIAMRHGIPIEDAEFYQFHPTGLWRIGVLLSEAVRGEGGILRNNTGEAFMARYAPTMKDLASRDVVSRAIYTEIREGRGIGPVGDQYVVCDITHLSPEVIDKKLPEVTGFARTYLGIEPKTEPIPVAPTAHYAMGGLPTNVDTEVLADAKGTVVSGLFAAGEVACVSVHGANRLGTNSLLDLVVFGRRGGRRMAEFCALADHLQLPQAPQAAAEAQVKALLANNGGESVARLRDEMQVAMMDLCGVYRTEESLTKCKGILQTLRARYRNVKVSDKGRLFNTELLEALELGYLLDISLAVVESAIARRESRGGHARDDYSKRDDAQWLKHTFATLQGDQVVLDYKPVTITRYQPVERVY